MGQLTWRSAVLLCFMILHHDFIIARNHIPYSGDKELEKDVVYDSLGPVYIGHDVAAFYNDVNSELKDDNLYSRTLSSSNSSNLTKSLQKTEGGRRRLFGLLLLLVSVVTTFASVGVDAYVSVKGCAGLYPSLKTFEDEFEAKKRDLEMRADKIDKSEEKAKVMKQRVEDASDSMGSIWQEIERISRLQEEILQALDPDILIAMNTKASEIAKEVRSTQNAAQEWSVEKIDGEFKGLFSSAETIVATFGSSLATIMVPIAKASFKYYKMSKIASTLTTANAKQILQAAPKAKAVLGFTDDAIKASVRSSGILKVVSRSSGTVRALKFFKGAGVVLSVIGIGVDIFSIVSTVLECRDRRDKAKESLDKLKEAEQEAIKAEKDVALYCDEVTTFWKENVIPAVRSESLKQALRGVKDLVQSAVSKSEELKKALAYIDQFIERIDEARAATTNTLLKNLFKGLASVEFTMSCYSNKFKLIGHVINGCKMGTAKLDKLFDEGIKLFPANSEECQTRSGLVYTSKEDVSNIVKEAAKVQGFHTKCPLNNLDLKELVCMKKREGITVEKIAEESNISDADVKRIVEKCTRELTPKEKKVVCSLRASTDWTDEVIAKNLKLSVKEVKNVSC